jgi:hypothetical protein
MATTRAKSFYNQYDIRRYVDENNFSVIMDTANAKYNKAQWRLLGNWDTPSDSKVWSQGQKTVPIMARASLLSTHGLKPMRNTSGWKFYTGSTPKFGHGYTMGEDDMFLLRDARNNTGASMQSLIYDSLLTNAQNILGGMHNELTHMCFELASTSEIHEASVDGSKYDFTFDFDQNQFQEVSPAWFIVSGDTITPNPDANIIKDFLELQRLFATTQSRDVNAWMMNKDTFDMIVDHPSVLSSYLANKNVQAVNQAAYIATRVELANFMHDRGVWPFLPIDFKSVHEEDGVPVEDAPAFDPQYIIAFNTKEKMFSIKNTNSIWKDRQNWGGIARNTMYSFVEERIAVLSTWNENPINNTVEFELYAGPVFRNLRNYGRVKVFGEASSSSSSSE